MNANFSFENNGKAINVGFTTSSSDYTGYLKVTENMKELVALDVIISPTLGVAHFAFKVSIEGFEGGGNLKYIFQKTQHGAYAVTIDGQMSFGTRTAEIFGIMKEIWEKYPEFLNSPEVPEWLKNSSIEVIEIAEGVLLLKSSSTIDLREKTLTNKGDVVITLAGTSIAVEGTGTYTLS